MRNHKRELAVTAVLLAFGGLLALSDALPDHLTPSALPLHPASGAQHFPDTAEVLIRALPQRPVQPDQSARSSASGSTFSPEYSFKRY